MKKDFNPFILSGYIGEEYFCDRENETKKLIENIENKRNTTIFSLRKLGKTGLIHHVFNILKSQKEVVCIYIDLFATRNMNDMANLLANAVYQAYPEKKHFGTRFAETFKSLRPVISIDSLSGTPELSLNLLEKTQLEKTIPQILGYLEGLDIPIVIAMDEFQQIVHYPEQNIEAILRTKIQTLKNCHFIFSGSHQTMMIEIFNSVKRPFYSSTSSMHLGKIDADKYALFIESLFIKHKFSITEDSIDYILNWSGRFTYFTQAICHHLFSNGNRKITIDVVQKICLSILQENEHIYFQYRSLLTDTQWHLLKAMAWEETIFRPYAKDFIQEYRLGSAAIVKRSLDSLLEKEMVYFDSTLEQPYYAVYDKFLMRWLQRLPK